MIDDVMVDLVIMDKVSEEDGMGGVENYWKEGARFKGAVSVDNSTEAQVAAKQQVTSFYTIVVKDNVVLDYKSVIKRVDDGQTFRITTDREDGKAPKNSIPYIQYKAELHSLV